MGIFLTNQITCCCCLKKIVNTQKKCCCCCCFTCKKFTGKFTFSFNNNKKRFTFFIDFLLTLWLFSADSSSRKVCVQTVWMVHNVHIIEFRWYINQHSSLCVRILCLFSEYFWIKIWTTTQLNVLCVFQQILKRQR